MYPSLQPTDLLSPPATKKLSPIPYSPIAPSVGVPLTDKSIDWLTLNQTIKVDLRRLLYSGPKVLTGLMCDVFW
jgi:hypothetical protein